MKVLITGASGFLGSAMTRRLRASGMKVVGIDLVSPAQGEAHPDDRVVDLLDTTAVRQVMEEVSPEFVVNFAARTDVSPDARTIDYRTNIDGVANLLRAIQKQATVRRAIWISTLLVSRVGRIPTHDEDYAPDTTYGESKVITEKLVRTFDGGGAEWVIARPNTVWGPGMSDHYLALLRYLERGWYFHVSSKTVHKSFSFIHNATFQLQQLLLAPTAAVCRRTFYIADYEPVDLKHWCNALAESLGAKPPRTVPGPLAHILARAGDLLNKSVAPGFKFNSYRLRNLVTPYIFDMSEMRTLTGALPHSFDESVRMTADWYRRSAR